jgi:hypothetical protein
MWRPRAQKSVGSWRQGNRPEPTHRGEDSAGEHIIARSSKSRTLAAPTGDRCPRESFPLYNLSLAPRPTTGPAAQDVLNW